MKARAAVAVLLIALLPAFAAVAQSMQQARDLYDQGNFLAAAAMAQALGGSPGLTLAVRATLAHYAYVDRAGATPEIFSRANEMADQAIQLDPGNIEAHLQAAVALGYRGRLSGPVPAHFAGYAKEARAHMLAALAIEPENAWAHAMLGAWHMEIVRKGGGFMARSLYGAKLDEGLLLYRRGLERDPDNLVLHYEFGLALAAQDAGRFRREATRQERVALAQQPKNAFERLAQARAQTLLNALLSGDKRELRQVIAAQTEFPQAVAPGGIKPQL